MFFYKEFRRRSGIKTRLISGAVGVAIIVTMLAINQRFEIIINIVMALAALLMVVELLTAKGLIKNLKISLPCMLYAAVTPILWSNRMGNVPYNTALISTVVFTVLLFIIMVAYNDEISFNDISFAFALSILITLSLSTIIAMCDLDRTHASFYVVLALGIPWLCDTGGLFVGLALGKHKLTPNISPKKTVEGAIGGVIIGTFSAAAIGFVFSNWIYTGDVYGMHVDYIILLMIGFINSIIAIFGDLSFSVIKRICHVKDYGTLIPGHGGIADRFDSVILTAPLLLIVTMYFPYIIK
ncbi:MAG: phosphatidate cytidylyltransferase [Bacillota bacterium]|nr:phosphatidate cytidylyltransferase [Bacillota bacterium]